MKADLYQRVIPALHPDLIVAVNLGGYSQPGDYFPFDDPNGARAAFATVDEHHEVVGRRAPGRRARRAPRGAGADPRRRRARSSIRTSAFRSRRSQEECRYTADPSPSPVDLLYRDVAKQTTGVYSLDLDRQVCPLLPICDPVIGGQIVKLDPSHLTADFSVTLAPYVETYMKSVGLLTR